MTNDRKPGIYKGLVGCGSPDLGWVTVDMTVPGGKATYTPSTDEARKRQADAFVGVAIAKSEARTGKKIKDDWKAGDTLRACFTSKTRLAHGKPYTILKAMEKDVAVCDADGNFVGTYAKWRFTRTVIKEEKPVTKQEKPSKIKLQVEDRDGLKIIEGEGYITSVRSGPSPQYWMPTINETRIEISFPFCANFSEPNKKPELPGEGYRLLLPDEQVLEGDEFWSPTMYRWQLSLKYYTGKQDAFQYRRRNKFTEGELVRIVKPCEANTHKNIVFWMTSMDRLDGTVLEMPKIQPSGIFYYAGWSFSQDWLAPANQAQKDAHDEKKAKLSRIAELENRIKGLQKDIDFLRKSL